MCYLEPDLPKDSTSCKKVIFGGVARIYHPMIALATAGRLYGGTSCWLGLKDNNFSGSPTEHFRDIVANNNRLAQVNPPFAILPN